ncbi:hypothetical protein FRB95_002213 [Tulasnella sp. JGI-2019a]|nr:hypothetical protein FRB95_002213 [Tulasnella sp. JGI-2019a]
MTTVTPLGLNPSKDIAQIRDELRATFESGKSLDIAYRKTQLIQLAYLFKARTLSRVLQCVVKSHLLILTFFPSLYDGRAQENEARFNEAFKVDLGRHELETATLEINGTIGECVTAWKNVDKWAKSKKIPLTEHSAS